MGNEKIPNFKLEEHVNFNVMVLRVLFYWPPKKEWSKWFKLLYTIHSFGMINFMLVCYNICEYVNMINAIGDFDRFLKALFLLFTNTAQSIKLIIMVYKFKQIKQVMKATTDEKFKPLSFEHHLVLKTTMHNYKLQMIFYFSTAFMALVFWTIFPLIDYGVKGRQLPFTAWYPFDAYRSPRYEFVFAYQIISMAIHAAINIATDNICYGLMLFVCAQFDILNDMLSNLHKTARKRVGATQEEISAEMNALLKGSIGRHRAVLKFLNDVLEAYSFIVVTQFVFGNAIICISMYQLVQSTADTVEFWSSLFYLICLLGQLFFYCWYGNEVTQKSEHLFRSAYMCDWVGCSITFQRNLLMFLMSLKVPVRVNVAFFCNLCVETYVAILRCSWSYFAVLQSIEEK